MFNYFKAVRRARRTEKLIQELVEVNKRETERIKKENEISELLEMAKRGDVNAQYELGKKWRIEESSPKEWLDWLDKATKQDHPEANLLMGTILFEGKKCRRNYLLAEKYANKALELGLSDASYLLSKIQKEKEKKAKSMYLDVGDSANKFEHSKGWRKALALGEVVTKSAANVAMFGMSVVAESVADNKNMSAEQRAKAREFRDKFKD